jgi:RNA polymerase sigma-70 factor (ECF subfamily)
VKAHLARGRTALRAAAAAPAPERRSPSPGVLRFIGLFNQRDFDGLRALLADDVRQRQSWHDLRTGAAEVGNFFGIYATLEPYHLAPAWLEGREVIAVFAAKGDPEPIYLMRVEWRDGRIAYIHDYRYVRYVMESADLRLG